MNISYLIVGNNGEITQTESVDSYLMEECIEGMTDIIKWEDNKFYRMTPIDCDDRDNWELVEQEIG